MDGTVTEALSWTSEAYISGNCCGTVTIFEAENMQIMLDFQMENEMVCFDTTYIGWYYLEVHLLNCMFVAIIHQYELCCPCLSKPVTCHLFYRVML